MTRETGVTTPTAFCCPVNMHHAMSAFACQASVQLLVILADCTHLFGREGWTPASADAFRHEPTKTQHQSIVAWAVRRRHCHRSASACRNRGNRFDTGQHGITASKCMHAHRHAIGMSMILLTSCCGCMHFSTVPTTCDMILLLVKLHAYGFAVKCCWAIVTADRCPAGLLLHVACQGQCLPKQHVITCMQWHPGQIIAFDQSCELQALLGGQPLLIVGVAEPIVLMYGYMYSFMQVGRHLSKTRISHG